jgi:hypothetical protein
MIAKIALLSTLLANSLWAHEVGEYPYALPSSRTQTGAIRGSVSPTGLVSTVVARRRGSEHGAIANAGAGINNGTFSLNRLEPGVYDIMLLPLDPKRGFAAHKEYLVQVGQYVEEEYKGSELEETDRANLQEFVTNVLPKLYREAYTLRDIAVIRRDSHVAVSFRDIALEWSATTTPRTVGLVPYTRFITSTTATAPTNHKSPRNIMAIGGNAARAFVVAHVREEFTYPWYNHSYMEGSVHKTKRVMEPKVERYEYDEKLLFSKKGGIWQLDLRQPINTLELSYHIGRFPEYAIDYRNVRYFVSGPLVGIAVDAGTTTTVGLLAIPRRE